VYRNLEKFRSVAASPVARAYYFYPVIFCTAPFNKSNAMPMLHTSGG